MRLRSAGLLIAPLLLAAPALAQQEEAADPVFNLPRSTQQQTGPQTGSAKQGPELDVFRGTPTPVTPPPVVIVPPILPQTPPAQPQPQPAAPAAPMEASPRQVAPERRASAPAAEPTASPEAAPAPAEAEAAPVAPAAPPTSPAQQPVPEPAQPTDQPSRWPWIAGGIAALLAIIAAATLRRRRHGDVEVEGEEDSAASAPPPPPAKPIVPATPHSAPSRAARPRPIPVSTERPRIELAMAVRNARLSLMGATIGYTLVIRNQGDRAAEDILIRSLITHAEEGQQEALTRFFAGELGLPTHSVVSVAPGESTKLTGELRLMPDQIRPVQMGNRALLIPLIAFDAQYRWSDGGEELIGAGRTGRAFIVGQEQSPPTERLAPFRLDLGPRQYRDPGSRATMLTLAS